MTKQELHPLAKKKGWTLNDFPEWGNNALYLQTIQGGYLQEGETPNNGYERIAQRASDLLKDSSLKDRFLTILKNGWLIPSTPLMCNFGNERGLPISCFSSYVPDSMEGIFRKNMEMALLSKHGGGTAYDFSGVRPIGSPIKGGKNGTTDGVIPFMKVFDSSILASKQGQTRRGAVAIYLDAQHKEIESFIKIREPKGDVNLQCLNIHQGVKFDDEFMNAVVNKDGKERAIWKEVLKKRVKTGEPYTFFTDNANKGLPESKNWIENNLKVRHSNLCIEMNLPTDENHSLVCCLSSLNLAKYDEWKDTDTVFLSILFLDAVISEFIEKGSQIYGIEDAVRFAIKSRALGLGVQGWHTFLQEKQLPFVGISANAWTNIIFKHIHDESLRGTQYLATIFGEPEWCKGTGRRNLTTTTIPPTRSSSKLGGGDSQGIEPIGANLYVDDDAKGTHIRRNRVLEALLEQRGKNVTAVWDQIDEDKGSVQNIRCLTKEEKDVFLTFREINQLELVRQAALRQKYIEQGQSINLAFFHDASAKWINQVHLEAWKLGIKGLYYLRSESILRADSGNQRDLYSECISCAV